MRRQEWTPGSIDSAETACAGWDVGERFGRRTRRAPHWRGLSDAAAMRNHQPVFAELECAHGVVTPMLARSTIRSIRGAAGQRDQADHAIADAPTTPPATAHHAANTHRHNELASAQLFRTLLLVIIRFSPDKDALGRNLAGNLTAPGASNGWLYHRLEARSRESSLLHSAGPRQREGRSSTGTYPRSPGRRRNVSRPSSPARRHTESLRLPARTALAGWRSVARGWTGSYTDPPRPEPRGRPETPPDGTAGRETPGLPGRSRFFLRCGSAGGRYCDKTPARVS